MSRSCNVWDNAARIQDNLPFRIGLDFRHSNTALSKHNWEPRQFVWLDYDDPLRIEMLQDVRTIVARIRSGSILAVTVQAERAREIDQADSDGDGSGLSAIDRFREFFTASRVPDDKFDDDLIGRPFANFSRTILLNEIDSALAVRQPRTGPDFMSFVPICSFEYADGVRMTTIIGLFYNHAERLKVEHCNFASLDFIPSDGSVIEIEVPKLTLREMHSLEAQLPQNGQQLELGSIPLDEADKFAKYYRYFPNFAVIEN